MRYQNDLAVNTCCVTVLYKSVSFPTRQRKCQILSPLRTEKGFQDLLFGGEPKFNLMI